MNYFELFIEWINSEPVVYLYEETIRLFQEFVCVMSEHNVIEF